MVNYLLNNLSQMPSRHSNSMCASLLLSSISSQTSCHPRQNPQDPSSKLSSNFIPYIQLVSKFCRILLSKYLLDLFCPLHYQLYSFKSLSFGQIIIVAPEHFPQTYYHLFLEPVISVSGIAILKTKIQYFCWHNTKEVHSLSLVVFISFLPTHPPPFLSLSPQTPYPTSCAVQETPLTHPPLPLSWPTYRESLTLRERTFHNKESLLGKRKDLNSIRETFPKLAKKEVKTSAILNY